MASAPPFVVIFMSAALHDFTAKTSAAFRAAAFEVSLTDNLFGSTITPAFPSFVVVLVFNKRNNGPATYLSTK